MYKSMDTTPPFSAKEGILFPNLLTFVHGIEVLFYIALSCTKLLCVLCISCDRSDTDIYKKLNFV